MTANDLAVTQRDGHFDGRQIAIDVRAHNVAIMLPNGDVVLIAHDAWRAAAALLPQAESIDKKAKR